MDSDRATVMNNVVASQLGRGCGVVNQLFGMIEGTVMAGTGDIELLHVPAMGE